MTQASGAGNPKLMALLIGLVGAAFMAVIAMVVLIPFSAFELVDMRATGFIVAGTAIWAFSVSFLFGLLRHCQKARESLLGRAPFEFPGLESILGPPPYLEPSPPTGEKEDDEGLGRDFIKIVGTPRTVRVTDGVTVEMLAQLAEASLDAVSQRALDAAGIITRDPSVEVNARVLVSWLSRNEFIKPIGNSRYEFTPLGLALLKSVSGTSSTPPPTTVE